MYKLTFPICMVFLFMFSKPAQAYKLSEHFNSKEFECKCCGQVKVNPKLIARLEKLRTMLGQPITITSGYRCPRHNRIVGGAANSQHMLGNAADIKVKGYTPREVADAARVCGFRYIEPIKLTPTWTHVDVRGE